MKKILFPLLLFFLIPTSLMSQSVTLTFTGRDGASRHVPMNRVVVTNLTRGWQETLVWPDTVLTMQNSVGIHDVETQNFASLQLSQNNPNPFNGVTDVLLTTADAGKVTLEIADANGRMVVPATDISPIVRANNHSPQQFRITLSATGTYVMTARQNGQTSSIKMVCNGGGNGNGIEYVGIVDTRHGTVQQSKSGAKGSTNKPFVFGDQMEYVGYATINDTEEESQRILQAQGSSQTFLLQFEGIQMQLPTVVTTLATDITDTTALCGGEVTTDGGAAVTDRGVCWNSTGIPMISDNCLHIGDSIGVFSDTLTNLLPNTTYYARAFAVNALGIVYGNEVSFTTTYDAQLPIVTTAPVTTIRDTTAVCGGDVFGASITSRGVCWNTSPSPTIEDSHTVDGNGMGDFTSTISGLQGGVTYHVRAYATNPVGTSYGEELTFTTFSLANDGQPCIGTPTLTDYDENVYSTVQIGFQCWMKENLRTTHFANGVSISVGYDGSLTTANALRYNPNGSSSNVSEYGYLYNWVGAMHYSASSNTNPSGVQGICPDGWHLPSNSEWAQMINYVGGHNEYICGESANATAKALASVSGWKNYTGTSTDKDCFPGYTPSTNDAAGFSAKAAGCHQGGGDYSYVNSTRAWAYYWSSTEFNSNQANYKGIRYDNANVQSAEYNKGYAVAVRCVRD